jgi:hypothetical protein
VEFNKLDQEGNASIKNVCSCTYYRTRYFGNSKRKLQWLGHVERMPDGRTVKKVYKNILEGKRSVGKRRKRWLKMLKMI